MKITDQALDRLLRSAARAPQRNLEPAARALEARVLAQYRAGRREEDTPGLLAFFRLGLGLACAVAGLAMLIGFQNYHPGTDGLLSLPDVAVNMALMR